MAVEGSPTLSRGCDEGCMWGVGIDGCGRFVDAAAGARCRGWFRHIATWCHNATDFFATFRFDIQRQRVGRPSLSHQPSMPHLWQYGRTLHDSAGVLM